MKDNTCPRCGSDKMVPNLFVEDHGDTFLPRALSVHIEAMPLALFLRGKQTAELQASLCGNCGHVEWVATNAQAFYEAYVAAMNATKETEPQSPNLESQS
jgi:ribosomal protein S27AE